MQCFRRAVNLSSEIGMFGVTVDASNEQAKQFYLEYGFIPLDNEALALFIPITTLSIAIE
ncbi:hypothetical protein [Argonema antarcticum]|uniref:hypothetical protein n=1 Tax=Argonema antarcticum TaxID=2942763 RepID=UPI00201362CE|nr:hypothetical protein [Argonema antarcticum]